MKRGLRAAFTSLRIVIAVGLVAYLGFSGVIDWVALTSLASVWPLTLAAFLLLVLCMVVTASRLCVLMRPQGLHLSLANSVKLTLIGIFFSLVLPGSTGGDAVRFYYAGAGNRGRLTEVATILVLDRAAGMFGLLVWPILVAPFFLDLVGATPVFITLLTAAGGVAAAMVVGLIVAASPSVRNHRWLSAVLSRIPLGRHVERVIDTVHGYRRSLGILAAAGGISILAHTLAVGVVLLIIRAMNPDGFAWSTGLLVPLGFMANALPITPGGLGVGEAAFDRLFSLAGLDGGAEAMLGWRVILLLVGLLGLAVYLRGTDRFIHLAPPSTGPVEPSSTRAAPPDAGSAPPPAAPTPRSDIGAVRASASVGPRVVREEAIQ